MFRLNHLVSSLLLLIVTIFIAAARDSEHSSTSRALCRLLDQQFVASNPWSTYSIIFEPITRGRLTIWTGSSNLPISEFDCYTTRNNTDELILKFANYANKIEWSFFDMNKGSTYQGISVNQCQNVEFKISLVQNQLREYSECNTVVDLVRKNINESSVDLKSNCQDCSTSLLALIDAQVEELFRTQLNQQILDNLYWHITQLLTSQHFTSPLPLGDDLD